MFFNTLIINFHIYTIIYITRNYVMNQTNTHNNNIIYADSKMPGRLSLVEKYMGHVRTPCDDTPHTMGHVRTITYFYILPNILNFWWKLKLYSCNMHSINYYGCKFILNAKYHNPGICTQFSRHGAFNLNRADLPPLPLLLI